ncbi:MAG: D-alanine--poly(phosphoribitol) ligase subunit 2 [Peptostreptococcaceae bacterium]|nr:D-alanine--poly(phosphoribitol) ligase subunit 2 [Peptostreptococcaceae bacterium]MDY5739475.1 D-alanine--poly(phosphoribitol) ligase subunit 2 [Anaerovoracaceae bacterium]SFE17125.1 D-alanine--poly(phosphoribitol) ligase subunit 2 [Peptostreptococcaceae bacterium pGA-8]
MEKKILEMIAELCGDEIVLEDGDINLLENDLIDSLDYTDLLVQFEEEFGIVMSPSELTREQMDTPNKIVEQVMARVA